MSSGRGSFYVKAAQNRNPLGFRIFTRLNLSLLNSCTSCTQTKGGFDNVSSVTITQTCVWVVYFNYTQQHLTYFNTCLFQDLLNSCRIKLINVTHTQARTIITLLNFLQAQSTSPVALRAVGSGFSLPGTSPVRKFA